jgi:hypothetical protein
MLTFWGSYQRAYVDFYEDQLVQFSYDWKALLHHYLYDADKPLIYNLFGNGSFTSITKMLNSGC